MKKYWISFILVIVVSFAVLSWVGVRIYQEKPPIPEKVVTESGSLVYTKSDIQEGQIIWQAMGGMQVGSIWGHGSYIAPDWTADWLHRELLEVLNSYAMAEFGNKFDNLSEDQKAILKNRISNLYKNSSCDPQSGVITIQDERHEAIKKNTEYYSDVFLNGNDEYSIQRLRYSSG